MSDWSFTDWLKLAWVIFFLVQGWRTCITDPKKK